MTHASNAKSGKHAPVRPRYTELEQNLRQQLGRYEQTDYMEVLKTLAFLSIAHRINSLILNPAYRCGHSLAPAYFLTFTLFFSFVHALIAILTLCTCFQSFLQNSAERSSLPRNHQVGSRQLLTLSSDLQSISICLPVNPEVSVILIIFTFFLAKL